MFHEHVQDVECLRGERRDMPIAQQLALRDVENNGPNAYRGMASRLVSGGSMTGGNLGGFGAFCKDFMCGQRARSHLRLVHKEAPVRVHPLHQGYAHRARLSAEICVRCNNKEAPW